MMTMRGSIIASSFAARVPQQLEMMGSNEISSERSPRDFS
jgi:hypothetical protein